MTENGKNPVDQALDLFVYAPLGFALSFREFLDEAAEKGRQQVQVAKVMGQFAVQMGQQEAEKRTRGARKQAEEVITSFLPGGARPPSTPSRPAPAPPPRPTVDPTQTGAPASTERVTEPGDPSIRATTPDVPRPAPAPPTPTVTSLAIPGYDTLSASQIVQRLGGLSQTELEAIGAYESAGRSRKTILNKVDQLRAGA